MQTVCIKLDKGLAKAIEKHMKEKHYTTKTEFFRESARKMIEDQKMKEEALRNLRKYYGSSKTKTTDEDLRRVREEIAKEWEKEEFLDTQSSSSGVLVSTDIQGRQSPNHKKQK